MDAHLYFTCEQGGSDFGQEIPICWSRASLEKASHCFGVTFSLSMLMGRGSIWYPRELWDLNEAFHQKKLHLYVVTYFVFTYM